MLCLLHALTTSSYTSSVNSTTLLAHASPLFAPCLGQYTVLIPLSSDEVLLHVVMSERIQAHLLFYWTAAEPRARRACVQHASGNTGDAGPGAQWLCRVSLASHAAVTERLFVALLDEPVCECLDCGGDPCRTDFGGPCKVCGTLSDSGCGDDFGELMGATCYTEAAAACACPAHPGCWSAGDEDGDARGMRCLEAGQSPARALGAITALQVATAITAVGNGTASDTSQKRRQYYHLPPLAHASAAAGAIMNVSASNPACSLSSYELVLTRSEGVRPPPSAVQTDSAGAFGSAAAGMVEGSGGYSPGGEECLSRCGVGELVSSGHAVTAASIVAAAFVLLLIGWVRRQRQRRQRNAALPTAVTAAASRVSVSDDDDGASDGGGGTSEDDGVTEASLSAALRVSTSTVAAL